MRKPLILVATLAVLGVGLSGCYGARPGYASDRHHRWHHHDRDRLQPQPLPRIGDEVEGRLRGGIVFRRERENGPTSHIRA